MIRKDSKGINTNKGTFTWSQIFDFLAERYSWTIEYIANLTNTQVVQLIEKGFLTTKKQERDYQKEHQHDNPDYSNEEKPTGKMRKAQINLLEIAGSLKAREKRGKKEIKGGPMTGTINKGNFGEKFNKNRKVIKKWQEIARKNNPDKDS